jgi:hypothetical protein
LGFRTILTIQKCYLSAQFHQIAAKSKAAAQRANDMANTADFGFSTAIRKSPYFDATVRWGATAFSVYNHMYIPRDFGDPEQNFWNLVNDAILCDVAVERQVEIIGPDAAKFAQMLTPRDLSSMAVGRCKYVLITAAAGGKPFLDFAR